MVNRSRQRFEVLLEEMRAGLQKVAEGHSLLDRRMGRMEQKFDERLGFVEQALMENSGQVHGLRQQVEGLRQDVQKLTERFDTHERSRA